MKSLTYFSHYFQLHLPLNSPLPGSELTKEPFRWDQRLFALVLRLPGTVSVESEQLTGVPLDDSAITPMCEVTGGTSLLKVTQRLKTIYLNVLKCAFHNLHVYVC